MLRRAALLVVALLPSTLRAACPFNVSANFGGHVAAASFAMEITPVYPETVIDLSRPARAAIAVSEIDFRMTPFVTSSFQARFVAFAPAGTDYIARNVSATMTFSPATSGSQPYVANLNPPLQFQAGDLLGITLLSAGGGVIAGLTSPPPTGALMFHADAPAGTHLGRDSAAVRTTTAVVAAEAIASVTCDQLTPPELFIPAVGDVTGLAHFVTDFTTVFAPSGFGGPMPLHLTLRDRQGGSPRIATADVNQQWGTALHADSLATTLNVTPPYFGSLTIAYGPQSYQGSEMSASARIVASTASCGGGETGTSIDGLSCAQIGREIAIPYHVPANHRLNFGVASAQLNSCGVFSPSTAVEIWVNSGPHVVVPMPGQSTQIGDITGAGGAQFGSTGAQDGVIYVRVTDEGSRIGAYTSLLDNTSQDSSIALGVVLQ